MDAEVRRERTHPAGGVSWERGRPARKWAEVPAFTWQSGPGVSRARRPRSQERLLKHLCGMGLRPRTSVRCGRDARAPRIGAGPRFRRRPVGKRADERASDGGADHVPRGPGDPRSRFLGHGLPRRRRRRRLLRRGRGPARRDRLALVLPRQLRALRDRARGVGRVRRTRQAREHRPRARRRPVRREHGGARIDPVPRPGRAVPRQPVRVARRGAPRHRRHAQAPPDGRGRVRGVVPEGRGRPAPLRRGHRARRRRLRGASPGRCSRSSGRTAPARPRC